MADQTAPQVQFRHADNRDLMAVAEVFLAAFPESVEHYIGHPIGPQAVADVFAICLDSEPDAFFAADLDGRVSGYIFAPSRFSRLARTAIGHGHLLRMFWRWITGRYGIGIRPVYLAARNWIDLWREAQSPALHSDARILSIAVDPSAQGHGIGSRLLQLGLDYLRSCGASVVRLEVRPNNPAAVHIYEKQGFEIRGRTRDTQGEWLIMLKALTHVEQT